MTTATNWKPRAMQALIPSLAVDNALEAIEWYKKALNATVDPSVIHKDPAGKKVMHAELKIADTVLFLNDVFTQMGGTASHSSFYLYVEDVDSAFAQAISAGGVQKMAVADQFYGDRMGSFADPYGQQWVLATHKQDLTPSELEKARDEFMAKMKDQKRQCPATDPNATNNH